MQESRFFSQISEHSRVVVLTGAGISAESGLRTFRDGGGLWEEHKVEEVATPKAFKRDPDLVWRFYNERRRQAKDAQPNTAHHTLSKLEAHLPAGNFVLITQNVDDLHRRASSKNVLHMHGELALLRCTECLKEIRTMKDFQGIPYCDCGGMLRPGIVWFGEMPAFLDDIQRHLNNCDIFIAIGTSGMVYPASGFLNIVQLSGGITVGVNLEEPLNMSSFDYFFKGKAGEILPKFVDKYLESISSGEN